MSDTTEWRTKALCRERDPNHYSKPDGVRMSTDLVDLYKKVADECFDCPVFVQCDLDAERYGDQLNTIRAGIIPKRMQSRVGRPTGTGTLLTNGACSKGHKIRGVEDLTAWNTCEACRVERKAMEMSTDCPKGHPWVEKNIHWTKAKNGKLRRKCLTCRREYDAARLQEKKRKKAAMMAA